MATILIFGAILSAFVLAFGLVFTPSFLQILQVPQTIMADASLYLRLMLIGFPFTFLYNALAQALRSVGDSKTPLYFVTFASLLNAVLDFVFVPIMGMGIFGATLSTVLAEALSALLCLIYVY